MKETEMVMAFSLGFLLCLILRDRKEGFSTFYKPAVLNSEEYY
jgi:hypothetical protein